jgi:hypothetical protein
MDPERLESSEFIWRRLLEDTPALAIGVPVAFALVICLLIAWFRREHRTVGLIIAPIAVAVLSAIYVPLALLLRPIPGFGWNVVMVPMLAIALFYVGMMYLKDAKSIHPIWAAFLGMLRCAVYGILAVVFLLPGCQTYDQSTTFPKVLVLFDVSGSTETQDDTPQPGQDPAALPTRQDKVIRFLTTNLDANKNVQVPFMDRVLKNTDVEAYRFGAKLDEKEIKRLKQGGTISVAELNRWLKLDKNDIIIPADTPEDKKAQLRQDAEDLIETLRSGTNIGGSANAMAKLEANSYVQAIIIVSDGKDNVVGDQGLKEFQQRVDNPRRSIPVFTIGVGESRQPASIRIEDLLAPESARPDDKFAVRVPIVSTGLPDEGNLPEEQREGVRVTLDATRIVKDETGKEIGRDQTFQLGPKLGKYKRAGEQQQAIVEFDIDVQDLKKVKAANDKPGAASLLEGTWRFVARVPRHPQEANFTKDEHVSDPVDVLVQKKELRILLFAGGPTNEFKFVKRLFSREKQEKRVELSVLLQTAVGLDHVDLDVDKDHVLSRFPDRRGEPKPGEKQYSLSEYDTVICMDPDWAQLSKEQLRNLKEWVDKDGGGIVFVAGPVNTYMLKRPGGLDLSSLATIFPVVPKDSRLHDIKVEGGLGHDSSRPYVLHFKPDAKDFDFLKIDEKGDSPTAGWDTFFWAGGAPELGKTPRRGIFNYYPIEKLKPGSRVIATFGGPKSSYYQESENKFSETPFIVSMPFGGGKTVYLGAGEFWRLRIKDGYHERFWIKLARYVAAGATMQKKYGNMYLPRLASVGNINIEAKLRDSRQEPLAPDTHPELLVRRIDKDAADDAKPDRYELKPRQFDDAGEWQGNFSVTAKVREAGKYEFKIPIPGTADSIRQEVIFRKPDPEKDDVRNNFDYLKQVASELKVLGDTISAEVKKEVQAKLETPSDPKDSPKLFFTLSTADEITKCLRQVEPKREKIKGPLYDLWDEGLKTGLHINAYDLSWGSPLVLGVIGFGILMFLGQKLFAGVFLAGTWLVGLVVAASRIFTGPWPDLPIDFAFVLCAVVVLLSLEWLTRKLLKLA